jgi:hypothetical protein
MRRRQFLSLLAPDPRKKIAAIVTEYRWFSHADVICGRLLGGHSANNVWTPPRLNLVSLYTDQVPKNDMSRDLAARHGFRIHPTIREALTLGTGKLAVDGVVFVGEHGDYPTNADGQKLYPRFELFNQILDVYEQSGRSVPTFFDKHFSYDWTKAEALFRRARHLQTPLLAGSSLPVTSRAPHLQPKLETRMTHAAAIGYGPLDAYGFHLLETLQCLVERRAGGETGVTQVRTISGEGIWQWLPGHAWARPLLDAAWKLDPASRQGTIESQAKSPVLFHLRHRDGFESVALMLSPSGNDRTVALETPAGVQTTLFGPPSVTRPLPHFDGLVHCMEDLILTGREPYPPERTLLTTGILAQAFASKRTGQPVANNDLLIAYRAPAEPFLQTA